MNKYFLISIGIFCAIFGAWFIAKILPSTTPNYFDVLRQYTGYHSGVKEDKYYLLLTQAEVDNFLSKKETDLKHSLPVTTTPKISPNEICLCVFMQDKGDIIIYPTEEQNKIVLKVKLVGQVLAEKDSNGNYIVISGSELVEGKLDEPFGYFIFPQTNKKIVVEREGVSTKGDLVWYTVREFNPR